MQSQGIFIWSLQWSFHYGSLMSYYMMVETRTSVIRCLIGNCKSSNDLASEVLEHHLHLSPWLSCCDQLIFEGRDIRLHLSMGKVANNFQQSLTYHISNGLSVQYLVSHFLAIVALFPQMLSPISNVFKVTYSQYRFI